MHIKPDLTQEPDFYLRLAAIYEYVNEVERTSPEARCEVQPMPLAAETVKTYISPFSDWRHLYALCGILLECLGMSGAPWCPTLSTTATASAIESVLPRNEARWHLEHAATVRKIAARRLAVHRAMQAPVNAALQRYRSRLREER